ncbi:hypothetical protein [Mycobacterium sp. URHB0021]
MSRGTFHHFHYCVLGRRDNMIYRMVKCATDRTTDSTTDRGFLDIVQTEAGAPLVMLVCLDRDFLKHALPEFLKRLFPAIFDELGDSYNAFSGIYSFVNPPQSLDNCLDPPQLHDGLEARYPTQRNAEVEI